MHDWYDWLTDVAIPLVAAGASVLVAVAALRVAKQGQELAQLASESESDRTRRAERARVAQEIRTFARAVESSMPAGLKFGITASRGSDRPAREVFESAESLVAALHPEDKIGGEFLLYEQAGKWFQDRNSANFEVMSITLGIVLKEWVADPASYAAE